MATSAAPSRRCCGSTSSLKRNWHNSMRPWASTGWPAKQRRALELFGSTRFPDAKRLQKRSNRIFSRRAVSAQHRPSAHPSRPWRAASTAQPCRSGSASTAPRSAPTGPALASSGAALSAPNRKSSPRARSAPIFGNLAGGSEIYSAHPAEGCFRSFAWTSTTLTGQALRRAARSAGIPKPAVVNLRAMTQV